MHPEINDDRVVPRRYLLMAGAATAAIAAFAGGGQSAEAATTDTLLDVVALPSQFPGIDPTGATDSSAAMQSALNSVPEGAALIIPSGTYLIGTNLQVAQGRSVTIIGYGATLVQTSAQSIFSIVSNYSSTVAVSAVSVVTKAFGSGASAPVATLTVPSAPSWVVGDIIKIVSDDMIPEARAATAGLGTRLGEFAVVHSVTGTTVTLTGLLRETYTTNVRAALISQQTIRIEGVSLYTADPRMGQVNQPLIQMTGLLNPVIRNVRAPRSGGRVLSFASCMGYHVEAVDVTYATDSTTDQTLGYGIIDAASSFGRVVGGTFRHVRHAFSTTTDAVSANSDPRGYGRTYAAKIIGAHASMTTSFSFDCHHESEGVEFIGCTATGGVPDGTTASAGFGLRGINHRVIACTVRDPDVGVQVYTDSVGGESRGHVISDLVVRNARTAAVRVNLHQSGHPSQNQRDSSENARIGGLVARGCLKALMVTNGIVTVSDLDFQAPAGASGNNYDGMLGQNSKVTIRGGVLDYEGNTAGTPRPLTTTPSAGSTPGVQETYVDALEVRANAGVVGRASAAFSGSDHIVHARKLLFTYPFASMPGVTRDESTYEWSCRVTPGVDASQNSSWYALLQGTAATQPITEILKSVSPHIHVNVSTGNAARTAAALPAGKLRGQELSFYLDGSGSFTLRNGTAYKTTLLAAANKVLTDGMSVWLFWDGTNWREH